jgi:hypothetical protein
MSDKVDEDFNRIKGFLEEGKFRLDNSEFEDNLMSKIILEKDYKVKVRNIIKKSLICFVGGIALCFALLLFFIFKNDSIEITGVVLLFSLGVFGLLVLDNYLNLLNNYKVLD